MLSLVNEEAAFYERARDNINEPDVMEGSWARVPHYILSNRQSDASPFVTTANLYNLMGGPWQFD